MLFLSLEDNDGVGKLIKKCWYIGSVRIHTRCAFNSSHAIFALASLWTYRLYTRLAGGGSKLVFWHVWTNAMSLENWRKVNLFAANSVFTALAPRWIQRTVYYLIYTHLLFVSHYLLFSALFLLCFTCASQFLFPHHISLSHCASVYKFDFSNGCPFSATLFCYTLFLLYCIPLWHMWEQDWKRADQFEVCCPYFCCDAHTVANNKPKSNFMTS